MYQTDNKEPIRDQEIVWVSEQHIVAIHISARLVINLRYNQLARKVTFSTFDVLLSMSYVFATHLPVNKIGK